MKTILLAAAVWLGISGAVYDPAHEEAAGSGAGTLTLQELKLKYADHFYFNGTGAKRLVALTFDDAPDPRYTPQILQILASEQIKATFFIVGERAERYPLMVEWIHRLGHVIGNHSYDHAYLPEQNLDLFRTRTLQTQQLLESITGYKPELFRPPYGAISEDKLIWARDNMLMVVNWNVDSLDWRGLNEVEVADNVFKDMKPGAIVLQHAGGGAGQDLNGTIKALPNIIRHLQAQGYVFVTVPEMIAADRQLHEQSPVELRTPDMAR